MIPPLTDKEREYVELHRERTSLWLMLPSARSWCAVHDLVFVRPEICLGCDRDLNPPMPNDIEPPDYWRSHARIGSDAFPSALHWLRCEHHDDTFPVGRMCAQCSRDLDDDSTMETT